MIQNAGFRDPELEFSSKKNFVKKETGLYRATTHNELLYRNLSLLFSFHFNAKTFNRCLSFDTNSFRNLLSAVQHKEDQVGMHLISFGGSARQATDRLADFILLLRLVSILQFSSI